MGETLKWTQQRGAPDTNRNVNGGIWMRFTEVEPIIRQRDEAFKLLERLVEADGQPFACELEAEIQSILADFRTLIAKGK